MPSVQGVEFHINLEERSLPFEASRFALRLYLSGAFRSQFNHYAERIFLLSLNQVTVRNSILAMFRNKRSLRETLQDTQVANVLSFMYNILHQSNVI